MAVETYLSLQQRLQLPAGLPYDPVWSAAPDFLAIISDYCTSQRPRSIVECSSGTSTLVLARCCQLVGHGSVCSLEHEAEHAERTRAHLDALGLGDYARVIHAPLQCFELGSTRYHWYSLDALAVTDIDMLVIDGPPGFLQKHSRYPALPLLHQRFADTCTVFLDDAARADEREIVSLWCSVLKPVENEYIETERGCVRMEFSSEAG